VTFWRLSILTSFELSQPGIHLFSRGIQSGGLVLFPGLDSVLAESLALLFALDILGDGLAYELVCRAMVCRRQALHALLYIRVNLDRHRASDSSRMYRR
jgi:hypothetical protein